MCKSETKQSTTWSSRCAQVCVCASTQWILDLVAYDKCNEQVEKCLFVAEEEGTIASRVKSRCDRRCLFGYSFSRIESIQLEFTQQKPSKSVAMTSPLCLPNGIECLPLRRRSFCLSSHFVSSVFVFDHWTNDMSNVPLSHLQPTNKQRHSENQTEKKKCREDKDVRRCRGFIYRWTFFPLRSKQINRNTKIVR